MALVLKDRVKESATSPGTGSVTLLGASVGFQSFTVIGNGNTCYYTISDQGGPNWEVGIGTYSTTGPTLARTTVLASSNAGSLTNFNAGTQDVFVTYPSERGVWLDASGNAIGLGTPAAFVGTNITGTASGLSIGGNAATATTAGTVTTNANLTGAVTSVGNATSLGSFTSANLAGALTDETGSGSAVFATSPTITGATLTTAALNGSLGATTPSTVVATTGSFTGPTPTGSALAVRTTGGDAVSITTRATGLGGVISATDTTFATYTNLDIICNGAFIKANNGATVLSIGSTGLAVTGDLTTTGNTILGNASTDTLNVGNGGLIKDASGNVGIGVTPSAWGSPFLGAFESKAGTALIGRSDAAQSFLFNNAYFNGSNYIYKANGFANFVVLDGYSGGMGFNIAPSGTAGNPITFTQAMTLDSSGNVGIGVTPSAWASTNVLEIGSYGTWFGAPIAGVGAYMGSNNYYGSGGFTYRTTAAASYYTQSAGAHTWHSAPSGTAGTAATFTQVMTLDASGNLALGAGAGRSKFASISGTDNTTADAAGFVGSFVGPTPSGQNSSISIESNSAIAADTGGVLAFGGRYSGTAYANWASIKGLKDNATSAEYGGYLSFYTRAMGANSAERMRIDSSGNVGIGTNNPTYKLTVGGDIYCTGSIVREAQYTATFPGAYATVVDLTTIGKGLIIYGYAMENAINTSTGIWLATGNGTTYTLTLVSQSVIGSGHGTIQLQMSNNGLQIRNALSTSIGNYKLSFVVLA